MKPQPPPIDLNRRQFLGRSAQNAAGVAAGMVALGSTASASGSDRPVRVGVIGVRNRGRVLAGSFAHHPDSVVTALCDVDASLEAAAMKAVADGQQTRPAWVSDFRRVLDDNSVDAVVIATPDHWHATMATLAGQAGKDVYLEKPVARTLLEGQQLVRMVQDTGIVLQTGLQQRSGSHFQSAVELLHSGRLGDVRLAKAWVANVRKPIVPKKDEPVPAGVDYDLWLGPAPERDFNPNRFHHHWQWFEDYGLGELGNWGVHLLDVARWGLNLELPERISASGGHYAFQGDHDFPDTLTATFHYPGHTITWEHRLWSNHGLEGRGSGVAFYGQAGTLVVDRSGWKVYDTREPLNCDASELLNSHIGNFLDCVRSRRQPVADIRTGHISTSLCQLGHIAWKLGREVRFDPASESVLDDPAADQLLAGAARDTWATTDARS